MSETVTECLPRPGEFDPLADESAGTLKPQGEGEPKAETGEADPP